MGTLIVCILSYLYNYSGSTSNSYLPLSS